MSLHDLVDPHINPHFYFKLPADVSLELKIAGRFVNKISFKFYYDLIGLENMLKYQISVTFEPFARSSKYNVLHSYSLNFYFQFI